MMDFARRLAPAAAADATRAVAVLPARFGGAGPVRENAAGMPMEAAPARAGLQPRQTDDRGSAAPDAVHEHALRDEAPPSPPPVRDAGLSSATPPRGAGDHATAPFRSVVGAASMHGPRVAPPAASRGIDQPAEDGEAAGLAAGPGAAFAAIATPGGSARRPLSEAALAARNAPASPAPRPIVHVTIERIEVRAPAAPAKHAPAPPPRAAAPGVSLGDYLRQRQRGGAR